MIQSEFSVRGINFLKRVPSDEYYTPEWVVKVIEKYLKKNSTIWCPFDTEDSKYVSYFKSKGYKVINSHINTGGGLL